VLLLTSTQAPNFLSFPHLTHFHPSTSPELLASRSHPHRDPGRYIIAVARQQLRKLRCKTRSTGAHHSTVTPVAMPVELRKRKAPAPPPEPPAKKQSKVSKAAAKVKEVKEAITKPRGRPAKAAVPTTNGKTLAASAAPSAAAAPAPAPAPAKPAGKPEVGDTISLDDFGGEIQQNDGTTTTLKALVDASKAGVVLFTYPKASTPGCKWWRISIISRFFTPHRA